MIIHRENAHAYEKTPYGVSKGRKRKLARIMIFYHEFERFDFRFARRPLVIEDPLTEGR